MSYTDYNKAIRKKCMDCSGFSSKEVGQCPILGCSLWPYRFGKDPKSAIKAELYTEEELKNSKTAQKERK
jgi:hypothetical protein